MKKNICVSESIKENPAHTGNSLNIINSLQGGKYCSCSSALRGENSFEATNGKRIKIVEVYGDKPVDEVLETFSKLILNSFQDIFHTF